MKIVFWQNMPSMHQSAMLRSLARLPGAEVILAVEGGVPDSHRQAGWYLPDLDGVTLVDARNRGARQALVDSSGPRAIHLLSGFFTFPIVWAVFHDLRRAGARIGIISEAFNPLGVKGWMRFRRARYLATRWGRHFDVVLAMGELGVSFFIAAGFPAERVHPFAYFVEDEIVDPDLARGSDSRYRIAFVGQMINRKGVDLLLRALGRIERTDYHLDLIGDGAARRSLEKMAISLGLSDRVTLHGVRPNSEIRRRLAEADLLVLPSRWDGWGTVVNEALSCGTPVVASDRCGASLFLGDSIRGERFAADSVQSLERSLSRRIAGGPPSPDDRRLIREWARTNIGGGLGAEYLSRVLETAGSGDRVVPPWQQDA